MRTLHLRNRYLFAIDAALLPTAAALAFAIRFETPALDPTLAAMLGVYIALSMPLRLALFWRLDLYARLWRFASASDLNSVLLASGGAAVIGAVVGAVGVPLLGVAVPGVARVPMSVVALDALLGALAIALPRLAVRRGARGPGVLRRVSPTPGSRRALVVGAGAAGATFVHEMCEHPQLGLRPVAFVDDDPSKRHRQLRGVPIVGPLADIARVVRDLAIDEIVIAMPTATGGTVRTVLDAAAVAGVPARTVPGLFELLSGRKSVSALRKVQIEDLLRRAPVETDLDQVRTLAAGKAVLVTGAGGSIGGELCRQVARLGPSRLIAVGRGENSVFELLNELKRDFPDLVLEPVIADVRDRARLERVFQRARPATVFHAAAHKHVPLMEQNVSEAILNNVLGTRVVAELAARYGAERFVLISSDKAVRPSSVMGATKRLAEGVVQAVGRQSRCRFMSVRFGNVLGSRGSVIPTFLRQIEQGGPVTVTHPEMRRYFMTIPEAVQLVLQAGAMGDGGEVFVLDMGEPVRVVDLARDLVRLSGLVEGQDVEIRFTGIRPGEKLYEELFFNHENAAPTEHTKVLRARNAALELGDDMSLDQLISLAAHNAPADDLRRGIRALVPEYTGAVPSSPAGASDVPGTYHDRSAESGPVVQPKPVHAAGVAAPAGLDLDSARVGRYARTAAPREGVPLAGAPWDGNPAGTAPSDGIVAPEGAIPHGY